MLRILPDVMTLLRLCSEFLFQFERNICLLEGVTHLCPYLAATYVEEAIHMIMPHLLPLRDPCDSFVLLDYERKGGKVQRQFNDRRTFLAMVRIDGKIAQRGKTHDAHGQIFQIWISL